MKILMLSWEYPPKNVGGISAHIYYLSKEVSKLGHEVHIITCEEGDAPNEEDDNGVFIHRVSPYKINTDDFVKWVMHLNFAMIQEGIKIIELYGKFDIIHAHDWLCVYSAKALKCSFCIPMICTIHATEHGRNDGIRTEMQRYISGAEWMLCYEAWKIVTCSNYMRQEVYNLFSPTWEKLWVIPNGVEANAFEFSFDRLGFRRQFAEDKENIVFFVGRHVFEKGIHLLAEAAKEVINQKSNVKFVIAGTGPMTEEIKNRIRNYGIDNKFVFTGYIDDNTKNKLYRVANAAIFPSIYEPFGIVALEAMAASCPVVVADVGGLGELVVHNKTGLKAYAGSSDSLAYNIKQILDNKILSNKLKNNAIKIVKEKYTWNKVALLTEEMYKLVKYEGKDTTWK
jgi:glycogen synthase